VAEINEVIDQMVKIRERMNERSKEFEKAQKRDRELWEKGEAWIMKKMEEQGTTNVATQTHTVFPTDSLKASVGDWGEVSSYIERTGDVDLLEHRISSKAVKQYMEENGGEVPPGVKTFSQRKINIRRKS